VRGAANDERYNYRPGRAAGCLRPPLPVQAAGRLSMSWLLVELGAEARYLARVAAPGPRPQAGEACRLHAPILPKLFLPPRR
jgi:hypothetical protein